MDSDWKKIQIPLGLVVTFVCIVLGGYAYLHSEFVVAADFKQYQEVQSRELRSIQRQQTIRSLERDQRSLETDVLMLDVKKETAKTQYTPMDKAVHDKKKTDLEEIKKELREMKVQEARDQGMR